MNHVNSVRNPQPVVGIPWYSESAWNRMKEISKDKESFHKSYAVWLAHADKSVVILTNRCKPFERLSIDPVSYAWWCQNWSLEHDKFSRRAYVQYLLKQKLRHLK